MVRGEPDMLEHAVCAGLWHRDDLDESLCAVNAAPSWSFAADGTPIKAEAVQSLRQAAVACSELHLAVMHGWADSHQC